MKTLVSSILIPLLLTACQSSIFHKNRETVFDNISHIEDSIHYKIDSLPSLDDVLGMNGQYVNIGDCNLYCEIEGKGTPMVLINGGPGGTHHYFHPWFSKAAKYCQVIYYDQRGCGKSDFNPGENGYSFEQAVDDLDRLRQQLGFKKWIVCGYSYGGAVAQFYTAVHPENTLAAVYIGAKPMIKDAGLNGTRQYDYMSEEEKQKIKEIYQLYREHKITFFQLLYNKEINGDWKRQHYYKPTNDEIIRASLYEWVNDNGFNHTMSASTNKYDLNHVFDECPIPALLCEGEGDLTWTANKKEIMQKYLPKAQYVLLGHSGHNVFSDEPGLFFSTLKNFVNHLQPTTDEEIVQWRKIADKTIEFQQEMFKREADFFALVKTQGIKKANNYFNTFRIEKPDKKLFSETGMNALGYSYFGDKDYDTAIQLFEMNVVEYPDSWNVYDSLGEAYLAIGDNEKAVGNYTKSVELNPDNENGKKVLKELRAHYN